MAVHLLDWAIWLIGALKKHIMYSKRQRNVANVKSQGKISVTANKTSKSVGSSDFTKSLNLTESTSLTFQYQLFPNPVLLSAVTKAEIIFAMQKVVSVMSHFTHNSFIQIDVLR